MALKTNKGLQDFSRNPLILLVRLQDSNPPPDDYKAFAIIHCFKHLASFQRFQNAANHTLKTHIQRESPIVLETPSGPDVRNGRRRKPPTRLELELGKGHFVTA
ncbi:hypothetical protein [Pandoraea terrae]|uniref:hypothetical protein n=1 Tax=Pandoraea terrae TaxID=1537710 RepID=UPI00123F5265|nr:hypothetical protein [Pandoraea terrae]